MAKLYGEIAAKSLLTLDKSFARANGQPLDASEVYYSLAAAKEYAAGAQAYIGQKIVVIENGVVTHYGIEDTAGNLKELGSKPVGDGLTITVADDGKISLANIPEVQKDEEGNDVPATYNAVLVNGKLTWVKPSATTVEGLSDLIEALTGRVDTAEADIDALQASVGVAAKPESAEGAGDAVAATGLFKAIADEIARATVAEEALGDRIDAIDFVDDDELAEAIKNFATTEYVDGKFDAVEHPVVGIASEDKILALGADKLISATVALAYDSDNKKIKLTGKDGADLGSVDATPFIKDGMLNDVSYDAETNTLTFKWNTDAGISEDTVVLSDIIEPYTAGNGLVLEGNEFAVKVADDSETFLTVDENGVKLSGVADAIATAKSEAISDAEDKIATAKQEAIDDAADDATSKANAAEQNAKDYADGKFATKEYVGTIPNGEDGNPKAANVVAYIEAKAAEVLSQATGGSSESAASVKGQLDTFKAEINPKVTKNTEDIATINEKLKDIEANADVNVVEVIKVNGSALIPDESKAVDITVPTKFTDITDDSGFDARITAAQNQADKGVNDASAAQTTANEAKAAAEANSTLLGTINGTVAGHTTTIGEHTTKIGALENFQTEHTAHYNTLNSIVSGHTTAIAGKAEQTALDAAVADIAKNATAIKTLNETTIPGINEEVGKKANSADVYTKAQIGDLAQDGEGKDKTIVQMIEDAKSAAIAGATYNDSELRSLIGDNANAISTLIGTKDGDDSKTVREIAADEVNTLIGGANSADTITNITTLIEYVNANGAEVTGIQTDIDNLQAIVAGIGGENQPATVAKLVEKEIAAIPLATLVRGDGDVVTVTKGLIIPEFNKFEMVDGKVTAVSTDLLVQGEKELVLNGGSASV